MGARHAALATITTRSGLDGSGAGWSGNAPGAAARVGLGRAGVDASRAEDLTVTGSATGPHPGALTDLGAGRGVTFNPTTDFQAGEQVTVRVPGVAVEEASGGVYTFTVARPGPPIDPNTMAEGGAGVATPQAQSLSSCSAVSRQYVSRPDLATVPGACTRGPGAGPGGDNVFSTAGGPTIFDRGGELVW